MPMCGYTHALQLYWSHTSTWVFSCKFAAYFQNTFYLEHLWEVASGFKKSGDVLAEKAETVEKRQIIKDKTL